MNKGINTAIKEFKTNLTNEINTRLNEGLPIEVVSLVLENLFAEVQKNVEIVLTAEAQQYEKEKEEDNQVTWLDLPTESEE